MPPPCFTTERMKNSKYLELDPAASGFLAPLSVPREMLVEPDEDAGPICAVRKMSPGAFGRRLLT